MATALLAAACAGCATFAEAPAPRGWLSPAGPGGPGADGYGAWVVIRGGSHGEGELAGELIVCRLDSLWVLTESGLRSRAMDRVRSVRVYKGVSQDGYVVSEDVVPVREASITRPNDSSVARDREADLRPWARFPQGWPPGLDPTSLRPKPVRQP